MDLFKRIKRNKKGSIQDVVTIGMILLFFAILILIGFTIATRFNAKIQAMPEMPTEAKTSSTQLLGHYTTTIDSSFLFLTIGLAIASIIMAALVRMHPIFIAFYFIGWAITIFLCGIFSNVYQGMATDPAFAAEASQLIFANYIMTKLPFIVGIIGIILMVFMYKTWSNGK